MDPVTVCVVATVGVLMMWTLMTAAVARLAHDYGTR